MRVRIGVVRGARIGMAAVGAMAVSTRATRTMAVGPLTLRIGGSGILIVI